MTVISVLSRSPIVARGLSEVLRQEGFDTSVMPPSSSPDLFLIGPDEIGGWAESVHLLSATAPVLVLVAPGHAVATAPGVSAKVEWSAPVEAVVRAIEGLITDEETTTTSTDPQPSLSARERQVLTYIADGLTQQQIAQRLAISRHTVDTYVRRIRAKLGLGNKAELARAAVLDAFTRP